MNFTHDLIVLVADGTMEAAIGSILKRCRSLNIRQIKAELIKAAGTSDPGCIHNCVGYLHSYLNTHHYALVMLDYEGCGQQQQTPTQIETDIQTRLVNDGWNKLSSEGLPMPRAEAVIIDPELEHWIWTNSPQLPHVLGWKDKLNLKTWLQQQNLWNQGLTKPPDHKAAFNKVLQKLKKIRSSSIYKNIAEKVSLQRCSDPAFQRFCQILQGWFP